MTELPTDILNSITKDIADEYGVEIDSDFVKYIQELQPKVARKFGFERKQTVRFFNLVTFEFDPNIEMSRELMRKLLLKHDGDVIKARAEFKTLSIEYCKDKHKASKLKRCTINKPIDKGNRYINNTLNL